MIEIPQEYKNNIFRLVIVFLAVLSLSYAVSVVTELKYLKNANPSFSSITLSGHGEVSAVPDIASVTFTIRKEGKTVKEAQEAVATVEKSALDSLKSNSVEDKDIKTINASFNPKYEYRYDTKALLPCTPYGCPPRSGSNVITGYEAYESISVKVRNTDDVGKIMQDLGALTVSDLNGPNFMIDDEAALKAEARKEAIEEAQEKAKVLAKDLGVKLGKVISFAEDGDYNMPMYYAKDMMNEAVAQSAPASIPKGENTIASDVTITYEIK